MASKGTLTIRIAGDAKSFADTLDETSDMLGGWAKNLAFGAAGALALAGGVAAGFLVDGFFEALDREAAADKLGAKLGLTEEEASRLGKVAADVYVDAWGESVGQIMGVMGELAEELGGFGDMSEAEIQHLTTAALALESVFGVDLAQSVNAVGQLLRNGLAPDARTAFDVIASGLRNGADRSDDFLDTLVEYSEQFGSLGLDAKEATSLIISGLGEGAYNADKVGDAVKEFTIRAIDGSKSTGRAFEILGLDADEMSRKIANGGPEAQEAMSTIIRALGDVGDAVRQDEAGVALFGSMWEDLGPDVIAALDPVTDKLGVVGGEIDLVTQQAGDNIQTRMIGMWRKFTNSIPEAIEQSGMLDDLDRVIDRFEQDGLAGAIEELQAVWEKHWPQLEAFLSDTVLPAMVDIGTEAGKAFAHALMAAAGDILTSWLDWLDDKLFPTIPEEKRIFSGGTEKALDVLNDPGAGAGVGGAGFGGLGGLGGGSGGGVLRLHRGGMVPGMSGEEVDARLLAGERVLPAGHTENRTMTLNVFNPVGEPAEAAVTRELQRAAYLGVW